MGKEGGVHAGCLRLPCRTQLEGVWELCDHTAACGSGRPVPWLGSRSLNYASGHSHLCGLSTGFCALHKAWPPASFLAVTPASPLGQHEPGERPGCVPPASDVLCGSILSMLVKPFGEPKNAEGGPFLGPATPPLPGEPSSPCPASLLTCAPWSRLLLHFFLGNKPHSLQLHV